MKTKKVNFWMDHCWALLCGIGFVMLCMYVTSCQSSAGDKKANVEAQRSITPPPINASVIIVSSSEISEPLHGFVYNSMVLFITIEGRKQSIELDQLEPLTVEEIISLNKDFSARLKAYSVFEKLSTAVEYKILLYVEQVGAPVATALEIVREDGKAPLYLTATK